MNKLTLYKNGELVREIDLEASQIIGRHASATLQLEAAEVSRNHADLFLDGGKLLIRDRSSANGTFVNGTRLNPEEPWVLKSRDVVTIGPFDMQIEVEAGDREPGPAPAAEEPKVELPPSSPLMMHLVDKREMIPVWSEGKTTLKVADIIEETHDVKTFRMIGTSPILFSYKPGQFVTLELEIDGADVKRSYSISSTPSRPHTLEITVKRVPGGLVSNWLHDNVQLGDEINLRGPAGKFTCFEYPSPKILLIGAGSGLTPLMSMCRWIVDTTADVDVIFFVSHRSPSDIIFRKEMEQVAARNIGIKGYVTVSSGSGGTESWLGLTGRISPDMLRMAVPDLLERHAFMCGPMPFMDAAKVILADLDFPMEHLHLESFGPARVAAGTKVPSRNAAPQTTAERRPQIDDGSPVATAAAPGASAAPSGTMEVKFGDGGVAGITDGSATILEVAEANGVEIPYACRMGACGTCKVRCEGKVEMGDAAIALADDEKSDGFILACCSRPVESVVIAV